MDDPLLPYYERELTFMRESGAEFAEKYPKIAGRLLLEPDRCEDPHTERLIEAFSFLTGRIHKKIDDSFPELTESLLQVIYPHYTRPLPAMTIVKFIPRLQNVPPSGYRIEKGTPLYSPPMKDTKLIFTTSQPVHLMPVAITNAESSFPRNPGTGSDKCIKIEFKTAPGLTLKKIEWPSTFRFFLNGHQQHIFNLYGMILNNCVQVEVVSFSDEDGVKVQQDIITLPAANLRPVGFSADEAILPWPEQSFDGYRLLCEYFAFAEKFLFFEITGLDCLRQMTGETFEINMAIGCSNTDRLLINRDTFCLHAAPAVNLFKQISLPIRIEHKKTEYPIYHDIHTKNTTEIFSIDKVVGVSDASDIPLHYRPFYSISHYKQEEDREAYWHIRRRRSPRKGDQGMDVFLAFTDSALAAAQPQCTTITVHTTCTNRDLPDRLIPGGLAKDFSLEAESPVDGIVCLMKPTRTRRLNPDGRLQWRLISHLSLNYLSLVDKNGRGLKELLRLYDMHHSAVTKQQIDGIETVSYKHVTMRIGRSFCRGIEVTIEFNEDKFVGSSLYLFASVLERFLAQYVSINSFSRLVVKSIQHPGVIKTWPPRNGNRVLL